MPAPGRLSMGDPAWLRMGDPGGAACPTRPTPVAHYRGRRPVEGPDQVRRRTISSIALENAACGHPDVQAAVIAAFHPKWQERPLLIVTRKAGSRLDRETLLDFLRPSVARWRLPDDVVFLPEMPMTATGKIHKLTLRRQFRDYKLPAAERAPASE